MSTAARIDELRKKFEEHPRRYFAPLANEYRKTGELALAIALCREHLPQQPGHMSGYIVFGQALYESGALAEARSVFEQALALDPENFIALRHLGDIAKMNGDTSAARRWYERVLDADPRNDDIAAQLASLTAIPTPPMSSPPVPVFIGIGAERTIAPTATPLLATSVGDTTNDTLSAPTPNVSMRAVDFDLVNTRLTHQAPLDLDAIEQLVDSVPDEASIETVRANTSVAAESDDSFGFPLRELSTDSIPIEPDPEFEVGIDAPVWPDTADLVARVVSPRSSTPVEVPITADAVAAFGRETGDPIGINASERLAAHLADFVRAEESVVPVDALGDGIVRGDDAWLRVETNEREPHGVPRIAPDVSATDDESVARSTELTWLVTPASNEALQWITANDRLDDDDVRPAAPEIASVFAETARGTEVPEVPELPELPSSPTVLDWPNHGLDDAFAPIIAHGNEAESPRGPAFVTETMAELLVSQGYMTRAVEVYDELSRRQPDNVALATRLSELRERIALRMDGGSVRYVTPVESAPPVSPLSPTYGTPVWVNSMIPSAEGGEAEAMLFLAAAGESKAPPPMRSARDTFARLAARRAPRRASSSAETAPSHEADGLASLFGAGANPADEAAAMELATAFAPISAERMADGSVFDLAPMPAVIFAPHYDDASAPSTSGSTADMGDAFAFDRFFPDPAVGTGRAAPAPAASNPTAGDDLAEFAAWLKGLGPQ